MQTCTGCKLAPSTTSCVRSAQNGSKGDKGKARTFDITTEKQGRMLQDTDAGKDSLKRAPPTQKRVASSNKWGRMKSKDLWMQKKTPSRWSDDLKDGGNLYQL